jgi:5-methylcytosine-specific restriction endonuclease McrA
MNKTSFKKGYTPWNKNKKGWLKHSEETKQKMSRDRKDKPLTIEHRLKISNSVPKGEKHHSWKNGVWKSNVALRNTVEYRIWRSLVKQRDKKCVDCGSEEELQVDHIKPFALYPELRFDVENGRILCFSCHRKTETWGGNSRRKKRIERTKISKRKNSRSHP